ncbi:MAG: efflux RND transporter periplasmic adaptor subunit [Nitrospirae bacterium]|nr:efflux RND transporter periplasmic adaptor subunit [Nitrospirota bacterium]
MCASFIISTLLVLTFIGPSYAGPKAPLKAPPTPAQGADKANDSDTPTVEIPPDKQQLIGVRITEAVKKQITKTIRTVGRVEYDERRLATVNTKVEGWIERLYVDYTGRYVKKGEPLADIYSPELVATQIEFLNLLKTLKGAKRPFEPAAGATGQDKTPNDALTDPAITGMLQRDAETIVDAARQRLKRWDITDAQIKKIEQKGEPLRTLTLFSPASGFVVQKTAVQGMKVMPGEKLFDLADLSTLWVIADVYEYELPMVKIGQAASINLSYYPDKVFTSKVDYIYPALSNETRTAKVRFVISNHGNTLKPQMFTNVELKINLGERLIIPGEAVIDTGTRQVVYVDKGDGFFEPRLIKTGIRADGMVEVREGLKEKEKVAASSAFLIDSESQLKGVVPNEKKNK